MLEKLAKRKSEIKNEKKAIRREIEQKVEDADKREFNNSHIEREITFNKNDELFKRFFEEGNYKEKSKALVEEKEQLLIEALNIIENNLEEIQEKYSHINRIDDIMKDIKEDTENKKDAVHYLLGQIN